MRRLGRHVDAVLTADRCAAVGSLGDTEITSQVLCLAVGADRDACVLAELLALLGGLRLARLRLALGCFGRRSGCLACWLSGGGLTCLFGSTLLLLCRALALLSSAFLLLSSTFTLLGGTLLLLSGTLGWLRCWGGCRTTGSWGGGGGLTGLSSFTGLRSFALGGFSLSGSLGGLTGLRSFTSFRGLSLAGSLSSLSCLTLALALSSTSLIPSGCLSAGDEVSERSALTLTLSLSRLRGWVGVASSSTEREAAGKNEGVSSALPLSLGRCSRSLSLSARSSSRGLSLGTGGGSGSLPLGGGTGLRRLLSGLLSTSADSQATCATKGDSSVADRDLAFFESLAAVRSSGCQASL